MLLGIDQDEKPRAISYGQPTRKADFDACMIRESGQNSFWTTLGDGLAPDGYISIQLDAAVPPEQAGPQRAEGKSLIATGAGLERTAP